MVRTSVGCILLALCVNACAAPDESPSAARIDTVELPAERLASWLVLGQPLPLDTAVVRGLARHWVEMTAVAHRMTSGDSLLSRDVVRQVTWPELRGHVVARWMAEHVERPTPGEDEVTAAYRQGDLRLVAHVLRATSPEAHPEERERQRTVAAAIRKELTRGGSWPEAVARSEDRATRSRNGLLGLVGRGELDPALERFAFGLRPGELSDVVESDRGFHLLYRPALEDARPAFTRLLVERWAEEARAERLRALMAEWGLDLEEDWESRARAVARDPWSALTRGRSVARHREGLVADSVLARYLVGLAPEALHDLAVADREALRSVVLDVAGQEVLWLEVVEDGLAPTQEERAEVRQVLRERLDAIRGALDLPLPSAMPPPSNGSGADLAERVSTYMEAVMARRRELVPVPAHLAAQLLREADWTVSGDGVGASVRRARRLLDEAGEA